VTIAQPSRASFASCGMLAFFSLSTASRSPISSLGIPQQAAFSTIT